MTARIHPTALVDPGARVGDDVRIGPYAVIGDGAVLEPGVRVGPGSLVGIDPLQPESDRLVGRVTLREGAVVGAHCRITGEATIGAGASLFDGCRVRGRVTVGARTELHDGVRLGSPGQFPGRHAWDGHVEIGEDCVLREGVTVTRPVLRGSTRIGPGSYLMARTQVDHDCLLGRDVKTATGVTLGGSVTVGDESYLGMNAVVHQGVVIGAGTMIGMNGVVMRHVPPYAVLVERRFTKINRRGLERRGWPEAAIREIEAFYAEGRRSVEPGETRPWGEAIRAFFEAIGDERYEALAAE